MCYTSNMIIICTKLTSVSGESVINGSSMHICHELYKLILASTINQEKFVVKNFFLLASCINEN